MGMLSLIRVEICDFVYSFLVIAIFEMSYGWFWRVILSSSKVLLASFEVVAETTNRLGCSVALCHIHKILNI